MDNWSREDLVNEINWLRGVSDRRYKRAQEMRNEIAELECRLLQSKKTNLQNRNKINRLEADLASVEVYSDKQAEVIKHYVNLIKELKNER
jgi:septal ring factor EnvC (AmiA/AmiB activator)